MITLQIDEIQAQILLLDEIQAQILLRVINDQSLNAAELREIISLEKQINEQLGTIMELG